LFRRKTLFRVIDDKIVEDPAGNLTPVAYNEGRPTHFMDKKKEGREFLRATDGQVRQATQQYSAITGQFWCMHNPAGTEDMCDQCPLENPPIRKFETGATRDADTDKLDYEAFFSPAVLRRRAEFMHKNRFQKDGSLRDGDNWKKGIPRREYVKSLWRHFWDVWGWSHDESPQEPIEDAICAAMFNLEGLLYGILKDKKGENK
jgi:hypothetical protein